MRDLGYKTYIVIKMPLGLIKWFGGKSWLVPKLLEITPEHHTSIEGFAGGLWYTINKVKSDVEIANDINWQIINMWETLRKKRSELKERCEFVLDSKELFDTYFMDYVEDGWDELDDVEQAFRFFYMTMHSFSATFGGFHSISVTSVLQHHKAYLNKLELFDDIWERIRNVMFTNDDVVNLLSLPSVDHDNVFIYLDPPYFNGGELYEKICGGHGYNIQDALLLRKKLSEFKNCKVLISIDEGEFFTKTLGWDMVEVEKTTALTSQAKPGRECLVYNYDPGLTKREITEVVDVNEF